MKPTITLYAPRKSNGKVRIALCSIVVGLAIGIVSTSVTRQDQTKDQICLTTEQHKSMEDDIEFFKGFHQEFTARLDSMDAEMMFDHTLEGKPTS